MTRATIPAVIITMLLSGCVPPDKSPGVVTWRSPSPAGSAAGIRVHRDRDGKTIYIQGVGGGYSTAIWRHCPVGSRWPDCARKAAP